MDSQMNALENLQAVDLDAGLVFSGQATGRLVKGFAQKTIYTPAIDQNYIFHDSSRDVIVWLLDPKDPLYITGPTGCGKTSCVKQLAARLNYPVFEVTGHGRLEFSDLVGHLAVRDGNMVFEYGPLALAMRYGAILLLNEIDLTAPEIAAGLNTVLDGSPLCISENGGEIITPHPMFRFCATANTNGGGDETGLYQGTQRQNLAWLDRFVICEMGYPDRKVEKKLLADRFSVIPKTVRDHMVAFANEVRKQFMGEGSVNKNSLEVTFSTRSLLRWADLTVRYQALASQGIQPITYALDRALAFRASRESRATLHELAERHFPKAATGTESTSAIKQEDEELEGADASVYLSKLRSAKLENSPTVHLRKATLTQNGIGSKDWIGVATPQGVKIRFGRTGETNHPLMIDAQNCAISPTNELLSRANKKVSEGYRLIKNNSKI